MKKLFCIAFIFLYVPIHVYCQDSLYFDSSCNRIKSREMAKYYELIIRNSDFVIGQEINYFDVKGKEVKSLESAVSYSIVLHELEFPDRKIEREFALDGKLKVEKQLIDVPNEKEDKKIISKLNGKYKEWYSSGTLRRNIDYKKGGFDGDLLTYWDNGAIQMGSSDLIDKSYVKLRSVVIGWELPNKWFRKSLIQGVKVSAYGNNLFVWTPASNTFIDPEVTSFGNDLSGQYGEYSANPSTRRFGFNLMVKF